MGSAFSNLSTQNIVAVVLVFGVISYTVLQRVTSPPAPSTSSDQPTTSSTSTKKGKKKKSPSSPSDNTPAVSTAITAAPIVVPFPTVVHVPGTFESTPASGQELTDTASAKPAKPKKKKAKKANSPSPAGTAATATTTGAATTSSVTGGGLRPIPFDAQSESSATAPEFSNPPTSKAAQKKKGGAPSSKQMSMSMSMSMSSLVDTDDTTWTRVEPRKRVNVGSSKTDAAASASGVGVPPTVETSGLSLSDVGANSSATGESSPVAERADDDLRTSMAEKPPKARKTGVEDMLETSETPGVRVIRVPPRADERPAAGFTWGDYEDVDDSRTADDADGEDEGGWVVKGSRSRTRSNRLASSTSSDQLQSTAQQQQQSRAAPETLSKKQRQNASKRDAQKSAKAEAEAERLAILAKHKRELEKARMAELAGGGGGGKGKGGKTSGGMMASVDEKGHLVWD